MYRFVVLSPFLCVAHCCFVFPPHRKGEITRWDDPEVVQANPELAAVGALNRKITYVIMSEGLRDIERTHPFPAWVIGL